MKTKTKEIWKDIENFPNHQASNTGFVRNKATKKIIGNTYKDKDGYYATTITGITRKHKEHLVHRIVALAFIPNPRRRKYVRHINGNITDNRVENLEWCSTLTVIANSEEETWFNLEGSYFRVSNYGNLEYQCDLKGKLTERTPKKYFDENGEVVVISYSGMRRGNSNSKPFPLMYTVAKHFVPNPENLPSVIRLDGDVTNNRADNLKWVTIAEKRQDNLLIKPKLKLKLIKFIIDLITELEQLKPVHEGKIPSELLSNYFDTLYDLPCTDLAPIATKLQNDRRFTLSGYSEAVENQTDQIILETINRNQ